jgi:hypothetical protein
MKKLAVFAFVIAAGAIQAQVTPTTPFATPAIFQENFDSTAANTYSALSIFGTPATAQQIGAGAGLVVQPYPGLISNPHLMVGNGVDIAINTTVPMRRFGAWFRSGFFGVFSSAARVFFYDASNNLIGSPQSIILTSNFVWYGWTANPKWKRIEIYGVVPGFPGAVGLDSMTIRPN